MAGLALELTGIEDFDNASIDFGDAARSLESGSGMWDGMLQRIALFILDEVDQQFETGGSHQIGGGFEQLNNDYLAWKEANFGDLPILTLTGEYRGSWGFDKEGDDGVIIYSQLEGTKHLWHEFGMPNRHGVLPERPVLMVTDETIAEIDTMFLTHFDQNIMARLGGS